MYTIGIENIHQLKRKEISPYKPTDLWTVKDYPYFETLSFKENEMLSCNSQGYKLHATWTTETQER